MDRDRRFPHWHCCESAEIEKNLYERAGKSAGLFLYHAFELLQETQVIFAEQPDIIDAILQ